MAIVRRSTNSQTQRKRGGSANRSARRFRASGKACRGMRQSLSVFGVVFTTRAGGGGGLACAAIHERQCGLRIDELASICAWTRYLGCLARVCVVFAIHHEVCACHVRLSRSAEMNFRLAVVTGASSCQFTVSLVSNSASLARVGRYLSFALRAGRTTAVRLAYIAACYTFFYVGEHFGERSQSRKVSAVLLVWLIYTVYDCLTYPSGFR